MLALRVNSGNEKKTRLKAVSWAENFSKFTTDQRRLFRSCEGFLERYEAFAPPGSAT
jgi:hypothetical protein